MCVNNKISHFILLGYFYVEKGTNRLNTKVGDICKGKRRFTSFFFNKDRSH